MPLHPDTPRTWRCPSCGMQITGGATKHECDAITLAARFDEQFRAWLLTPHGRFAVHYARKRLLP